MSARTALIAGSGALPQALAGALGGDAVWVSFDGGAAPAGLTLLPARIEALGALFDDLRAADVGAVIFAGAMVRPAIDPAVMDAHARALAAHFSRGDDALLREVIALFEAEGFAVRAPLDVAPELALPAGTCWGKAPGKQERADIARAAEILAALGPIDVGQGAVVAGGQALGIETLQGTAAMLDFVARTDPALRRAPGVFVKAPKPGQEMRIDAPTVGPDTVAQVAAAGLAGIAIAPGGVIVLEQAATRAALEAAGLFLVTLEPPA